MDKETPIESYLKALRKINQQLQQDNVRMDDAVELYARGARIAKEAYGILDSYKQKIDRIESSTLAGDEN